MCAAGLQIQTPEASKPGEIDDDRLEPKAKSSDQIQSTRAPSLPPDVIVVVTSRFELDDESFSSRDDCKPFG